MTLWFPSENITGRSTPGRWELSLCARNNWGFSVSEEVFGNASVARPKTAGSLSSVTPRDVTTFFRWLGNDGGLAGWAPPVEWLRILFS